MTFNPKESIDFNGNTGPFIQYTHARIQSVLRKAAESNFAASASEDVAEKLSEKEQYLIRLLTKYPNIVAEAGTEFSPSVVANYVYDLAKEYNQFYHDHSILKENNSEIRGFRLSLSLLTARILKSGMYLLGIEVPDRM